MSVKKVVSASVIALFLAIAGAAVAQSDARAEAPERQRLVNVSIDSRPEYAEIILDGKFVGTTPLNYRVTPGVHDVKLVRGRYTNWSRQLTVAPEMPTNVVGLLTPAEHAQPCK